MASPLGVTHAPTLAETFEVLYRTHYAGLCDLVYGYVGSRDTARELGQRFHLLLNRELILRSSQRFLRLFLICDVARDFCEADKFAAVIPDGVNDSAGPELRAVLAHTQALGLIATRGIIQGI